MAAATQTQGYWLPLEFLATNSSLLILIGFTPIVHGTGGKMRRAIHFVKENAFLLLLLAGVFLISITYYNMIVSDMAGELLKLHQ